MFASSTHDANIAPARVDGAHAPPDQAAPPPKPLVRGKDQGCRKPSRDRSSPAVAGATERGRPGIALARAGRRAHT